MSGSTDPNSEELYIGVMSGTSLDGVDSALVDLSGKPKLERTHFLPYPESLKAALLALHVPGPDELARSARLGVELATLYAAAVERLLQNDLRPERIRAIGCHGQTVRHRPAEGYTLQLGNPALLAERSGITVVADFRSRDIAAGGQGAPLVPAFHAACFRDPRVHRVVLNIGGIANLTDLPLEGAITGFDTGPGNVLLDAWAREHIGKDFDPGGAFAAGGQVVPVLLEAALADSYFARSAPKSTGRDHFNLSWLRSLGVGRYGAQDVQATLAELTARTIADAILRCCDGASEVFVCGSGVHNTDLQRRLHAALPGRMIASTEVLGIHPDWVESMAFAWLAQRALKGEPGSLPEVTGAAGQRVLGAIYRA